MIDSAQKSTYFRLYKEQVLQLVIHIKLNLHLSFSQMAKLNLIL